MRKYLYFFLLLIFSKSALAVVSDSNRIEGYVTSYDDKRIVIESGNQMVTIPAELYKYKVKTGERISVKLSSDELSKIKSENIKKKK